MPDDAPLLSDALPEGQPPPNVPDYTLLRRIGRGSYGDVWLARSVTGVFRVIKIVQRSRFEDDRPYLRELEGISRFQAAVSGRPRQLALLHVGRNDDAGYFYYVMEPADDAETGSAIDPDRYVPLTLREMLKRRERLPASECIQFALELARGLAVLHGENLSHRDIKPSNVIFVQRVPKLADVGLVAAADATLSGVGTPGYLPPEGPGSAAADIYSLGKVLYAMATGMDQTQYPRLPRELADHPDAPLLREINGIILKACNPYPAERHPSVEALAGDLEVIQAGRSVVRYEEFRKRSRAFLIITAAVAIVAGSAAALFVWRSQVLQRANEQSRLALYRSDLALVNLSIITGDFARARAALDRHRPASGEKDLRGLEWYILAEAVKGEGSPLETIPNPVAISKIAVDPTGRWVAASFIDDRIGLWDLRNGRLARIIENARVLGGFLPDGRIVIDEPDRAIRYETTDGRAVERWPTGLRLRTVLSNGGLLTISPQGDFVFRLLHRETANPRFEFNLSSRYPGAELSGLDITSDGKFVAIGFYFEEGAVRERRIASVAISESREIWTTPASDRLGWVLASPDNAHFTAAIGWLTPVIMRFDSPEYQLPIVGHTARVNDAAYSLDGSYLATASADQTIRTWDSKTGTQISSQQGLDRPPSAVSWVPNGSRIIAADEGGNIRSFPSRPASKMTTVEGLFDDLHGDLAIASQDQLIAVSQSTNSIAILSADSLRPIANIPNLFQPISFSESDNILYAFSSDWSLWAADTTSGNSTLVGKPLPAEFSVVAWAVSPDSKKIVMTGEAGALAIIDISSARVALAQDPSTSRIWGIAFTEDSQEVWSGGADGSIRRWSASDASLIDTVSQTEPEIQALAISPDRQLLAVSSFRDSSIRTLHLKTGHWSAPRFPHSRYAQSVFFTDAGRRLVSGGVDGRVVVSSVPNLEEITAFNIADRTDPSGDEGIATLKLSPRQGFLAALTEDGRLQVWRAHGKPK